MSKRRVSVHDVSLSSLNAGDEIVLEDGTIATITTLEPREIEVKQVKKVFYMEFEAANKKGRKSLFSSVHMEDDIIEAVRPPLNRVLRTFLGKWRKAS